MYGLTRATTTLLAAGVAGLLIWVATRIHDTSVGGFWAVYGLIAGAGLIMALSQLLGGWTKWGWPTLAVTFFLIAFVPIAIVSLWIVLAAEPGHGWFHRHVLSWSGDIHVGGLVTGLKEYVAVFAFGIGLVFGFSFDTAGPRRRAVPVERDVAVDRRAADEPLTAEREAAATSTPRTAPVGPRERQPVGSTRTTDQP
jgi:hypothetical protein